jgi:2-oxoglutarate dehydrogenase E1 component
MQDEKSIDWAAAELLAYGSILQEGNDVRMSGQDVKRGTFSHRHAVISDEKTGEEFNRLGLINKNQGEFRIYNSHLSEYAVLGFEYGYSLASPDSLVIWEAQFGDFSNTAQCIIDQFIASGESKWSRCSGLVMLLPHGYEGQGPEHSSARLERFLQMAAEHNIVITNITDSANLFHGIRRQQKWDFRKPLINMSPKSLLRHPRTSSPIADLFKGTFKEIIDDSSVKDASKVKRLLLCSGKVAFDLIEKKENENRDDIAIVRLEQLYPINDMFLDRIFNKYKQADIVWVQEEPENMGAWQYMLNRFYKTRTIECVARKVSASTATGYKKQHLKEQEEILNRAFNG